MRRVAVIQMACSDNFSGNVEKAVEMIESAAKEGAQIIATQELFMTPYFCQDIEDRRFFDYVKRYNDASTFETFSKMAKEYKVVLPISYVESSNTVFYNSVTVFNECGQNIGTYRKSHIPVGPGYYEKYYFAQGDSGCKVFKTSYGNIGIGICWDQWFPEVSRILALQGADVILYPTAIGSEPNKPEYSSLEHWKTVIRGQAAANMIPVAVANRIGSEKGESAHIDFFGSSFITDHFGNIKTMANSTDDAVLYADFYYEAIKRDRAYWGIFRDRRPDLYQALLTQGGTIEKSNR